MSMTHSFLTSLRASLGSAPTRGLTNHEDPTPSTVVQPITIREKLRNVISSPTKVMHEANGETTVDKRESLIRDKLARFASLPVSEIFRFVCLP
jgi:hypothetical protein